MVVPIPAAYRRHMFHSMTSRKAAAVESRLFILEHRLPKITESDLEMLQGALTDACIRLTTRGETVYYLGSTFLPGPERLLSLFRAVNVDAVRSVSESCHAPMTYVELAVELPEPSFK